MRIWQRLRDLFRDESVMSAAWLEREKNISRVEFHGVQWRFPVQKLRDASGWRNRQVLKNDQKRKRA